MASPDRVASPVSFDRTRSTCATALVMSPSTALGVSFPGEIIWKRLREAGFDEETVKRRDKAALIAYVTRLEAEIYDYQCNMGLILLEKKDLESKYNEIKVSSESAEIMYKRDKAVNLSALGEARKREENLKKALGIEKECLANIEKTLHEMRAESAEIKIAYESKLSEAQSTMEAAQNMFDEAKSKIHEAEASQAEVIRCQNTALRTLHDAEAREDTIRRRITSFNSECETKEKELGLQRQCLNDRQKILHQEQERLMDGQNLLSQREEYVHRRLKELSLAEKELTEARRKFEEDSLILREEKANLELIISALATREEVVIKREALLDKRDRELLILQEKISNKEFDEIQRLKAEYQSSFERNSCEFDAKMEKQRKLLEDEIEVKTRICGDREVDLKKREERIMEMENSVQMDLHCISEKQDDVTKKLQLVVEKEKSLLHKEKVIESKLQDLKTEKEEISKMKDDLQNEKIKILHAEEKLILTENERNVILVLESKLKEEIDSFRIQMLELEIEADKLKSEKEKFEIEWDLIDEKREELRKDADFISKEREAVCIYLRNELDNLNIEKENLRNQLKQNADSLSHERDEFMRKMEIEHSDWLIKFHKEKDYFMKDVMLQRNELENSISRRREEVESYLREKEEAFEQGKNKELRNIASQKEEISRQLKHVSSELKRMENERLEIANDREQRQTEWSEIKSFIDDLNIQREKLQKQRELLHKDREEIDKQIQHLMKLDNLQIELERRTLYDPNAENLEENNGNLFSSKELYHLAALKNDDARDFEKTSLADDTKAKFSSKSDSNNNLPPPVPLTWFRKCAEVLFKLSPERISEATFQEDSKNILSADSKHYHENTEDAQSLDFRRNREEKICHTVEDTLIAVNEDKCKSNERSRYLFPLRGKRLCHNVSNDHSGSKPDHNHVKKLRQNNLAEMEAVLDCQGGREIPGDHAAEDIILEAVGSTAVFRLAADGFELKEHEDFDDERHEHPSLGAKIKKFFIT